MSGFESDQAVRDLECDDIDFCAFENALRNMDWISKGVYPGKDYDLDGSFVSANIIHAKKLVNAVLPRMEAAYLALISAVRIGSRERSNSAPVEVNSAVAAIAYAFSNNCEDNYDAMLFLRWWNEGEFDKIRRNFEDVPEDVFIGADPLYKKGG